MIKSELTNFNYSCFKIPIGDATLRPRPILTNHPIDRSVTGSMLRRAKSKKVIQIKIKRKVQIAESHYGAIGFAGGMNSYEYAGGNPMTYFDSSGLDREIIRSYDLIPHDYVRVFDPQMPGNETYIDFGPASGKSNVFLNLFIDIFNSN